MAVPAAVVAAAATAARSQPAGTDKPATARTSRGRPPRIRAVDDSEVQFDERGLVPCIVQDWRTGEVLTLAYMNAEALARTRETGE